jgi:hypothetical protein
MVAREVAKLAEHCSKWARNAPDNAPGRQLSLSGVGDDKRRAEQGDEYDATANHDVPPAACRVNGLPGLLVP